MRNAGHVGRTVSIKIRFADFSTITRSRTLQVPTDTAKEIFDVARGLYEALGLQRVRIRLVGVRMEGLDDASEAPHQMAFDEPAHGHRDAEVAIDALRSRFGATAVQPGRLTPGKTEQKGQE
jgi:DNA polymerase-4